MTDKAYVRCQDVENGDWWTIPTGSKLHEILWAIVERTGITPIVPLLLIREPWRGLELGRMINGTDRLVTPEDVRKFVDAEPWEPAYTNLVAGQALLRRGDFDRMRDRWLAQTRADQ